MMTPEQPKKKAQISPEMARLIDKIIEENADRRKLAKPSDVHNVDGLISAILEKNDELYKRLA